CAIALQARLPSVPSRPLEASVTLWEATTPVKPPVMHGPRLRAGLGERTQEGGISTVAPEDLATPIHSLPPILHTCDPSPMQNCSEGARGLSVPWRVNGIFTVTTISPGPRPRQCPDRYTIRAGRNLPDKEFRYLRTVIVTAAVYWGFDSMLHLAANIPS